MSKKREKPYLYVQRKGIYLAPEMNMDAEIISELPFGTRFKVTIESGRSPKKLRFYWSFLKKVVDATGCAPNVESLHEALKVSIGYVTPVMVRGYQINVPRSIAFDKMDEAEFSLFLRDALEFISSSYSITPEMVFGSERM